MAILRESTGTWRKGDLHVLQGPGQGFAENFRFLMTRAEIDADYYAFCDQDDRWDEAKLATAIEWLSQRGDRPALWCSRTRLISADGADLGHSILFARPPSFRNALVQSIAGGNTMVMNRKARDLLLEASRRTSFVSHDWWSYQIVTGAGGDFHYSAKAWTAYRQHPGNLVGGNNAWQARLARVRQLFRGRFNRWNECNLAGLQQCEDLLTPDAVSAMRQFARARSAPLPARLLSLRRSGVYRQSALDQISLYAACIIRRI